MSHHSKMIEQQTEDKNTHKRTKKNVERHPPVRPRKARTDSMFRSVMKNDASLFAGTLLSFNVMVDHERATRTLPFPVWRILSDLERKMIIRKKVKIAGCHLNVRLRLDGMWLT